MDVKSRSSMDKFPRAYTLRELSRNSREQQHCPDATFIFILVFHPASFQQRLTQFRAEGKFKEPRGPRLYPPSCSATWPIIVRVYGREFRMHGRVQSTRSSWISVRLTPSRTTAVQHDATRSISPFIGGTVDSIKLHQNAADARVFGPGFGASMGHSDSVARRRCIDIPVTVLSPIVSRSKHRLLSPLSLSLSLSLCQLFLSLENRSPSTRRYRSESAPRELHYRSNYIRLSVDEVAGQRSSRILVWWLHLIRLG